MAIDFIKEPGDRIQGPMVQTKLLRGTTTDMLIVKLSHLCSGGAGVKEYINLLGAIYTQLSNEKIPIHKWIGIFVHQIKIK